MIGSDDSEQAGTDGGSGIESTNVGDVRDGGDGDGEGVQVI